MICVKTKKILKSLISVILFCCILLSVLFSCNGGTNGTNDITDTSDVSDLSSSSASITSETDNTDNANTGETTAADAANNANMGTETEAGYTAKEIVDAAIAAYPAGDVPDMEYFFSGAGEDSDNYLDPMVAGFLINGLFAALPEFGYLYDFAFDTPVGRRVFEIDVLRVKKSEMQNLDIAKTLLETRLQTKMKMKGDVLVYVPGDAPLLDSAKVITVENYAILLATTDNSIAENIINNMMKNGGNSVSNGGGGNNVLENLTTAETTETTPNQTTSDSEIIETETTEILTENITQPTQSEAEATNAALDGVVNIEPETAFDFNLITTDEKKPEDNIPRDQMTRTPTVRVHSYSHDTSYIIGGSCEEGAKIRVTGGAEEIFTGSDYGEYLVEIPFAGTGSSVLKLTAIIDGKLPSDEITFIVKPQNNISYYEDSGIYGVVIGYNYMSYFDDCLPDYLGTNLLKDDEIAALQARTEKKIQDLRDNGCNAEIIYFFIPNTMRIWPEDVPKRYTEYKDDTLKRQWKEAVTKGGATILDLTDLMMSHKYDEFKIWHKTDSHWSEYGAYLGYTELMKYIAQKFPDAAPRPGSDFEFYNERVNFGDIYATLGLSLSDLCETSTFANFKFDPPHFNTDYNTGHVNIYDQDCTMGMSVRPIHARVEFKQTTHTNLQGNFPSAYIFRDSFEGPLHAFITDRFSTATFKGMWDYSFKAKEIAAVNPDYVIYIINERNIKNILY